MNNQEMQDNLPVEKLIVKRTEEGYELYADATLLITTKTHEDMQMVLDLLYGGEEPVDYVRRPQ